MSKQRMFLRKALSAAWSLALLALFPALVQGTSGPMFSHVTVGVEDGSNEMSATVADYDSDGDYDIFAAASNTPDRLYQNDGSGNFTDVAPGLGLNDGGDGRGAVWGDFDNDGDADLFVARIGTHLFYVNNGVGGFTESAAAAGVQSASNGQGASVVDYDNDGDLDLYLANTGGHENRLYQNQGNATFVLDAAAGINKAGHHIQGAWGDYDDDGDQDLYLTDNYSTLPNSLHRNDGGSFVDISVSSGTNHTGHGEGAVWFDYDGDGDLDLHTMVENGADRLYRNNGGGSFTNVASGDLADTGPGVGTGAADFDLDGDLDIFVTRNNAPNRLYVNQGGGSFLEEGTSRGVHDNGLMRGAAFADFDGDGDLDIYASHYSGGNRYYRNQASGVNWLHVALEGVISNRDAVGARITAVVGADSQRRDVDGGAGFFSQSSRPVELGLSSASQVDALTVEWPSGIVQTYTNVLANQVLSIVETSTITVTIPHLTSPYGQQVVVPVEVSETSGAGIVSAEIFVDYDGDLLTPTGVEANGTLVETGWSIETNIEEGGQIDTYKIAMATDDDVLAGAGDLIRIIFQVADRRSPASSPLTLAHVLFNDGDPTHVKVDGSVTLVGVDGSIASAPAEIIPREDVTVTIDDADENRDGNSPDSFEVRVTNGAQTETLTVTETGNATGLFEGTISSVFSLGATSGDGIVQAQAGDLIESCYDDSLDANGVTVERCATTDVIGGNDGSVAITLVSQPGDPLYIQVIDADLNASFSSAETASVTVTNARTAESFTVVLTEVDVDDEVFFGSLPTVAGSSTATEMNTAEEDVVSVTYDDVVTAVGDQQDRTADDEVIDPWGDADDNENLQAFDAAQVLLDVLSGGTLLTGVGELAANVDLDPVGTGISPFDASLILQKRVGLILSFPVQDPSSTNHPQGDPVSPKGIVEQRLLTLVPGDGYLSVVADDRSGIVSGELLIEGIDGRVEMGAELGDFLSAYRVTEDGLRVVFAGSEAVTGPGELLRVDGVGSGDVRLTRVTFNDGRIGAQMDYAAADAVPLRFALLPNAPNPFNPETAIRFALPQESAVRLEVFDALGQRVRTLVAEMLPAGMHQAVWDGRNEAGVRVGNGVYFYRLRAGEWRSGAAHPADLRFEQMSRMLLLK